MNKADLVEAIAKAADLSKSSASRSLEAMLGAIEDSLRRGESVTLAGFGTFQVGARAARTGRNPRTGDVVRIKAAGVAKFRAGKALKDAIN